MPDGVAIRSGYLSLLGRAVPRPPGIPRTPAAPAMQCMSFLRATAGVAMPVLSALAIREKTQPDVRSTLSVIDQGSATRPSRTLGNPPVSRTTASVPRRDPRVEKPSHQERSALFGTSEPEAKDPYLANIGPRFSRPGISRAAHGPVPSFTPRDLPGAPWKAIVSVILAPFRSDPLDIKRVSLFGRQLTQCLTRWGACDRRKPIID